MDCLHCVHPDCINERPMTRQARYYWRHRDRLLAEKREKYRRKRMNLKDYQRGRNDGLALALKIVQEGGREALEAEIKTEV